VQQRLHVLDCSGKRQRTDAARFAIKGNYVIAARRTILEHEYFPAALSAEIEQLISRAPQKAGEIKVVRLEGGFLYPSQSFLSS